MTLKLYKTPIGGGQEVPENRVFTVPAGLKVCRMDAFLGKALHDAGFSREKIKQAIVSGLVSLNGKSCIKPSTPVFPGDVIMTAFPDPSADLTPEQGDLTVLWHDEHIAVCNKPAGLPVHPAPGLEKGTLAHRLLHHFPVLAAQGGMRPGIVHRLDKDTSGLMLVALSETARLALARAFAHREIKKEYLALIFGVPKKQTGSVTDPLGRSPTNKTKMAVVPLSKGGREAHSDYTTLFADPAGRFSLLRVAIHTGRTHQIRVHMQHIGHPLLGDAAYRLPNLPPLPAPEPARQMLHAYKLAFTHPVTGEYLSFHAAPPPDFASLALNLATPMQRVIITGSPGGGKSTLSQAIRNSGAPVWSADETVRQLYEKGADGWHLLASRYGTRFVPDPSSGVDKKTLYVAMAESNTLRREVEHLIHPLVFHNLEIFWQTQELHGESLATAEIPLALESGHNSTDKNTATMPSIRREITIAIWCPFAKRRERMMRTRGWSGETIALMESWQWPEDKKVRAANLVVDNSGDPEDMARRSQKLIGVLAFLRERTRERIRIYMERLWR